MRTIRRGVMVPRERWERGDEDGDGTVPLGAGAAGWLVSLEWYDGSGREEYYLGVNVPRTNQSGQHRKHGWLGETNNISAHSHGWHRVERIGARWVTLREAAETPEEYDSSIRYARMDLGSRMDDPNGATP